MSNLRSVFVRPNSSFLDVPVRYASDDKTRLNQIKRLEGIMPYTFEGVMCYVKSVGGILLFAFTLWMLARYNVIAFPAFQKK